VGMGKAGMGATSGPRTTHASDTWTCPGEPYASRREAASTAASVKHTRRTDGHQRVLTGTPGYSRGTRRTPSGATQQPGPSGGSDLTTKPSGRAYEQTSKQTNKHTNKQTNKQAKKQTNKQTNKQTSEQTSKQANKQANQAARGRPCGRGRAPVSPKKA
jgi:hypothetical protein